jgi:hypothetical protein
MSKDYSFTGDAAVIIGSSTKKSDYDKVADNTRELNQRIEGLAFLGGFLPKAGAWTVTRDGNGRVTQISFTVSPVGTVTVSYDDVNGGRVAYVQVVLTDPVVSTIRETFTYNANNEVTGSTRTVS